VDTLKRERILKDQKEYLSKEIIEQLGIILTHPKEHEQENFPGQLSSFLLERFENGGYEILLFSRKSKNYIRKWFLSRILTFGNLGEKEKILATIAFNGNPEMERLFHLIVKKTIRRKTFLLLETYELCRVLYPDSFPSLPNVKDPKTEPRFLITVVPKTKRKVQRSNRVRNPSAVGGKSRQGISPLPSFPSGETGPSNVDEIFLETYKLLVQQETSSV